MVAYFLRDFYMLMSSNYLLYKIGSQLYVSEKTDSNFVSYI